MRKGILENTVYGLPKSAHHSPAQIDKLWNIHAMEFYIALIMNKIHLHAHNTDESYKLNVEGKKQPSFK